MTETNGSARRYNGYTLQMRRPTAEGLAKLDSNEDGKLDADEMALAHRIADADGNGDISWQERKNLDQMLGERGNSSRELQNFLDLRAADRAASVANPANADRAEATAAYEQAKDKLDNAEREEWQALARAGITLASTPKPEQSHAELVAERNTLPSVAELEDRVAQDRAGLKQAKQQVEAASQKASLAKLKLESTPKFIDDLVKGREQQVKEQRALMKEAPDLFAKRRKLAQLQRDFDSSTDPQQRAKLHRQIKLLEMHNPDTAQAKLDKLETEAAKFRGQQQAGKAAKVELEQAKAQLAKAGTARRAATAKLKGSQADLARAKLLDKQIPYAKVRDEHAARVKAAKQELATTKVRHVATTQTATTAQSLLDAARVRQAQATEITDHKREAEKLAKEMSELPQKVASDSTVQDAAKQLAKAQHIKKLVDEGKLDRADVDMDKVNADIEKNGAIVRGAEQRIENKAAEVAGKLRDPAFQKAMQELPAEERAEVLQKMCGSIAGTKAGKRLFKQTIQPALEGKAGAPPFWREMFDGTKVGVKVATSMVETWGAHIAAKGGARATKLLDQATCRALGVSPSKLPDLQEAIKLERAGNYKAAQRKLERSGLGRLSHNLGRITSVTGNVLNLTVAVDVLNDPSFRNVAAAAEGALDAASLAQFINKSPAAKALGQGAGKIAAPLSALVSGIDLADAIGNNDTGAIVGSSMQTAGALLTTVGLCSGVGLPLALVGGILQAGGALVSYVFGNSPTENYLEKVAPEYLPD